MKLSRILDNILQVLDNREKDVILRRYGLKGESESLSEIANYYNLTRERIRQIQEKSISKLKPLIAENEDLNYLFQEAKKLLEPIGSRPAKSFLQLVLKSFNFQDFELRIFRFFSLFSPQIIFHPGDEILDNFYSRDEDLSQVIRHSLRKIYFYFLENKEPLPEDSVFKIVLQEIKTHLNQEPSKNDIIDLLSILKTINRNPFNFWGLKNHPFIEPRCLKDKIYLILKTNGSPMHFMEIYKKLKELREFSDISSTWLKEYNINSLRNELIRHPEFVLVGKGFYGLKEWKLVEGTAKELILKILKEKKKIKKEELWQIVSSEKQIKKSSFYVYLKQFKKIKQINDYLIYDG